MSDKYYWTIVFYNLLGLLSFYYLTAIALFTLRRHYQPLTFRSPLLLALTLAGLALSSVWCVLYLLFDSNGIEAYYDIICSQWDWLLWLADYFIIVPFALRAVRVIFIFTPKKRKARGVTEDDDGDGSDNASDSVSDSDEPGEVLSVNSPPHTPPLLTALTRSPAYHRALTSLTLFKYFALIFISLSAIKALLYYQFHLSTSHGFGCSHSSTELWELLAFLSLIALIYILNRLRSVKNEIRDDYGQYREFAVVTAIWALYWTATAVLGVVRGGSLLNTLTGSPVLLSLHLYRMIHTPIVIARNVALTVITVLHPIYLSYSHTFSPLWSSCDSLLSLDSLLRDIICVQYFREYLLGRQRVQLVLCWVEIELFKDFYEALKARSKNNRVSDSNDFVGGDEDGSMLTLDDSLDSMHSMQSASSRSLSWSKMNNDDREAIRTEASRIYDRYLVPHASMDVGLSPVLLHRITRDLNNDLLSLTVFDDVSNELYQRMNEELGGFLASAECHRCWQELDREEKLRESLIQSGMIELQ